MKIIDISWPITEQMTEYKNRRSVYIKQIKDYTIDKVRETEIHMHAHSGTHLDAPSHFLQRGKTVDQIPLDTMIGNCTVVDLTHIKDCINETDIAGIQTSAAILLIKTSNSLLQENLSFESKFVYISSAAAKALVDRKIRCVGFDYLGIERNQINHETHIVLLNSDITIIEGLRLGAVTPGDYFLCCLPIALVCTDAAPARAVLIAAD